MAQRKKWSKDEKLRILREAEDQGVTETIRKHEISLGTYYGWKKNLELLGDKSLGLFLFNPFGTRRLMFFLEAVGDSWSLTICTLLMV